MMNCQADDTETGGESSPSALQLCGNAEAYPRDVAVRFELRNGKYGPYFHDLRMNYDMPLLEVLNTLNRYALRQAQLKWYVETYGEPQQAQRQIEERSDTASPRIDPEA